MFISDSWNRRFRYLSQREMAVVQPACQTARALAHMRLGLGLEHSSQSLRDPSGRAAAIRGGNRIIGVSYWTTQLKACPLAAPQSSSIDWPFPAVKLPGRHENSIFSSVRPLLNFEVQTLRGREKHAIRSLVTSHQLCLSAVTPQLYDNPIERNALLP